MSRTKLSVIALIGLLAVGTLLLVSPNVWAQRSGFRGGAGGQGFTYVVKFICGEVTVADAQNEFLAPGEYYTVINVHNPNEDIASYGIDWFKKIVTDYYEVQTVATDVDADRIRPMFIAQKTTNSTHIIRWVGQDNVGQTVGLQNPPRGKIQDFSLSRDEAAQANCREIRQIIRAADPKFDDNDLIKGFVLIYSKVQLDVTAIYTACDRGTTDALDCDATGVGTGRGVSTINVQRIQPNGTVPPAGLGLEESAAFSGTTFPTTEKNTDCPQGGCQYVVKFICGEITAPTGGTGLPNLESDLAPAEYYTDIDIHNPNPNAVSLAKLFAVDPETPEISGKLTSPDFFSLDVDDALQITCADIRARDNAAPTSPTFFKGFVVITSLQKLDIVATYTACQWTNPGLGCSAADGATGTNDVRSLEVRQGKDIFLSSIAPDPADLPAAGGASVAARPVLQKSGTGFIFQLAGAGVGAWPMTAINVQVYSTKGQAVFVSGWQIGNRLSWRPMTMDGRPLANGVYLYVIQGKDALGRVVRTVGKFVVLR